MAPRRCFLNERLQPVAGLEQGRVAKLLADLDVDEFTARETATRELIRRFDTVEWNVRKALANDPSPEARRRLQRILASNRDKALSGEALRPLRAVEVLEQIGDPESRKVLTGLAAGAEGARITREAKAALERLEKRLTK